MPDSPSSDFNRVRDDYSITIAGYQDAPGGQTIPVGLPVEEGETFPREVDEAHRVLFQVDDPNGDTHWYWLMGGVEDWEDAIWRVVDLARAEGYGELSE